MARVSPPSALRNPLTYILGVDAHVAVLRTLVRHGGGLAVSEIVQRSGVSKSSVRLALMALEPLGLIATEGTPTNRLHRFNPKSYFASQIETLFQAEADRFAEILDAVRQSTADCASPIASLCVYGSVAVGSDRPGSDLDILIVFDGALRAEDLARVREHLRAPADLLGFAPNVVGLDRSDVRRMMRERDPWWQRVTENLMLLLGAHPTTFASEPDRRRHG